ncbi:MAG TPA: preprotein translocase subunit SecG [Ferruginibacter sp.]|nr:preprotein translocase subunit SecG [Ferruginibacter sp.]
MLALFGVLIIIFSIVLGLIILVQNPKGGGLSGSLSGLGNQLMGVKQSTDILEKGTWFFGAIVALLCLASPAFIPKDGSSNDILNNAPTSVPQPKSALPSNTVPMQGTTPATTPTGQ